VGLSGSYSAEKIARQIKHLIDAGHAGQILVGHDLVPYFYNDYTAPKKEPAGWKSEDCDFTIVTTKLTNALADLGVAERDVRAILVDNPRRVLAF
jgi:predicted metal-dependent phosphotriesterase family hydrolase